MDLPLKLDSVDGESSIPAANPIKNTTSIVNSEYPNNNVLTTKPNGFDQMHSQKFIETTKPSTLDDERINNVSSLILDDEEEGLPVQVLYSYDPLEDDELKLIKGKYKIF